LIRCFSLAITTSHLEADVKNVNVIRLEVSTLLAIWLPEHVVVNLALLEENAINVNHIITVSLQKDAFGVIATSQALKQLSVMLILDSVSVKIMWKEDGVINVQKIAMICDVDV
jgi:hypothetical protein